VQKTIEACRVHYPTALAVMDGVLLPPNVKNAICMPKADQLVKAVSAASIFAKCDRDELMILLADEYPHYGFHNNVGYGTPQHKRALQAKGPCPVHRYSIGCVQEAADKFGVGYATTSKSSQNKGAPGKILGWRQPPRGMRVSTSSSKR
jgi:ribonuclease HII